uniref:Similar to EBS1 (EMS-MUTAGENIZED BRI1 SUPPRESSOR 1) n=1 Tax=Arundo donax TaxID=35708 RepID=A0A0A9D208_ARUDO
MVSILVRNSPNVLETKTYRCPEATEKMFMVSPCLASLQSVILSAFIFDDASPLMKLEAHFKRLLFQPLLSIFSWKWWSSAAFNNSSCSLPFFFCTSMGISLPLKLSMAMSFGGSSYRSALRPGASFRYHTPGETFICQ